MGHGYLRVPIDLRRATGYGYARLTLTYVWKGCAYSRVFRLPGLQSGPGR
jgi:hypothetical protein